MIKIERYQRGFTIVELLIVIVVIGILAAITIVAYNGIAGRAALSVLQNDLKTAAKVLENDKTTSTNDSYPASLELADGGKGLRASSGVGYQYSVNNGLNPKTFCLTATKGLSSYYVDQTNAIQQGYCVGQVAPADNIAPVITVAGSLAGYADGTGADVQFNRPRDITLNTNGIFYVSDFNNYRVRAVTVAGVTTSFSGAGTVGFANGSATSAKIRQGDGMAHDAAGNLYLADYSNYRIRKIATDGSMTTFAGSGAAGAADGTGVAATFNEPKGVAVDGSGNVFVADSTNNLIRKITPSGVVTTIAGTGARGYVDGPALSAQFGEPRGIALDSSGNLFIADIFSNAIRKISTSGVVSTFAGSSEAGSVDGNGLNARFNGPRNIIIDSSNNLYVSDLFNNRIRKITPAGVVTTIAGSVAGYADGIGTNALFFEPRGMALDGLGNLYVVDSGNNRIRKIQL